jgi:hypothetical protein
MALMGRERGQGFVLPIGRGRMRPVPNEPAAVIFLLAILKPNAMATAFNVLASRHLRPVRQLREVTVPWFEAV